MKSHRLEKICISNLVLLTLICIILFVTVQATAAEMPSYALQQEIPDDFIVQPLETKPQSASAKKAGRLFTSKPLPATYDSRDEGINTLVQDQRPWQLCWAFSALSAGESSMQSAGIADNSLNLSEMHLGYFFQGPVYDRLGNSTGDKTTFINSDYLSCGNNNKFTTFALANWIGGADENKYPYDTEFYSNCNNEASCDDASHLQNAFWISGQDKNTIKQAIIDNGAVGISYYYQESSYNDETDSYYNSLYTATNHAVTLIGWDDEYSADNFLETPDSDGAWLVKNSWGSDMNNEGYFWLSYKDASINSSSAVAFVLQFEEGNNYSYNYHYDGSYGTHNMQLDNGGSIAAIYTVCGSENGFDERLDAVGFALASPNADYSIQIYTGIQNKNNPVSGVPQFEEEQTGHTVACGYYTVPLLHPVSLKAGETFSVVITLNTSNDVMTDVFIDESYQNGSWIKFECSQAEGQTFYRLPNQMWQDLANSEKTARIKAYTNELSYASMSSMQFGEEIHTMQIGDNYTQLPTIQPENVADEQLIWNSSCPEVASVDDNGMVCAISAGSTYISARSAQNSISASYEIVVLPADSLKFKKNVIRINKGEKLKLNELLSDNSLFEQIEWYSSDDNVAAISDDVITAVSIGKANITAQLGSISADCVFEVVQPINSAKISVDKQVYSGSKAEPHPSVSINGVSLTENVDYTVSWKNNNGAGTGELIIQGIGNYTGQATCSFPICCAQPAVTVSNNTTSGKPVIKWSAVDGAAKYEVWRSTSKDGTYARMSTVSGTSLTNKSATAGTKYFYKVRAVADDGTKSDFSTIKSIVCDCAKPVVKATNVAKSGKIKLSWAAVEGATKYEVWRSTSKDGTYTKMYTTTGTSYTNSNATAGKMYYYKVKAICANTNGNSAFSAIVSRTCDCARPDVSIKLSSGHLKLSWDKVTGAEKYYVYRATSKSGTYTKIGSTTSVSYTDKTAKAGKTYYYKVKAINTKSAANSAYSLVDSIKAK